MIAPFKLMHEAVDAIRDLPGVRHARRRAFDRKFESASGHMFRGVFTSFEAALAAAPRSLPHSYDNPESANLYINRMTLQQTDYPSMFWLAQSLRDGKRSIFDLGGHIGIKYYAFKDKMNFPDDLLWTVCDLPAVIARGAELAIERSVEKTLTFVDQPHDVAGYDVLYSSGCLQYLPYTLGELLSSITEKPGTIVVNTTPLHESKSFFTLNSIGTAFCPYRVTMESEFVDAIVKQGYSVVDRWRNVGKGMEIPFEDGLDIEAYSGYCFARR